MTSAKDLAERRSPAKALAAERNAKIRALRAEGVSNQAIAERFGMTKGGVSKLVKGLGLPRSGR